MIDLNKLHKITVTVDPFTYLALKHLAEIKDLTLEEYTGDLLIHNNKTVYCVAERYFETWVKKEEDICTNNEE